MTDSNGTKIGEQGHYPYGESWYQSSTTTKWQYTSYERDAESGNDYAMARYDVSRLGRFSAPDPLAGSPADPQSLNRYSYARNDPVNLVDPSGLFIRENPDRGGNGLFEWEPWDCVAVMYMRRTLDDPSSSYGTIEIQEDMLSAMCVPYPPRQIRLEGGGGRGRRKGSPRRSYDVNLTVLNDCVAALGINTTIYAFKPSAPGGSGYAIGIGKDTYSRGGQTVPIVVTNDASTYNAAQLGAMCGVPSAYGCTTGYPYNNFTNNDNNAFGTVATQVHELGHSLFMIQAGSAVIPEPAPMGDALEDCVKRNHGIQ